MPILGRSPESIRDRKGSAERFRTSGGKAAKTSNPDDLILVSVAEVGTIMRNPLIAGTLSLLIPGLGQIYNGRILIGIIWMLIFGISWIGSVGFFGLIIHVISAWCAYSFAKDHPVRA